MFYATTTYEVHTFKNKNKRTSLRDIFVYHFLLYLFTRCCNLVIIKTRDYDIAHDENAMSLLITETKPVLKISQYSKENNCVGVSF